MKVPFPVILFGIYYVGQTPGRAIAHESKDENQLIDSNVRHLESKAKDVIYHESDTALDEEDDDYDNAGVHVMESDTALDDDEENFDNTEVTGPFKDYYSEDEFEQYEDYEGRKMLAEATGEESLAEPAKGGVRGLVAAKPKRFLLHFDDAYLVYVPSSGILQITTEGNVLSYGGDWEVKKMKSYLYHMRRRNWWRGDFYWKVNTSRRQVYRVRGGTFGQYGGTEEILGDIGVDNVGSSYNPVRFFLRLRDAYLVHVPGTRTLQIAAEGNVLSYGHDWEMKQMKTYLYQMRQNNWKRGGFYWTVNTSRKQLYRVRGGTFGQLGGTYTTLHDVEVQPVY